MKVISTALLIALSLLVALSLETRMTSGYLCELALIVIGLIVSLGILFGMWIDAEWAFPLAILFFAGSIANLIWLFSATHAFTVFAFGLLVNIGGLALGFVSLEDYPWEEPLEIYETDKPKTKRKRR